MDTRKGGCLLNGLYISKGQVYQKDIATLKRYRENYYKITLHKMMRQAGYEEIEEDEAKQGPGKKNTAKNEGKLEASISRTKAAIFELAICNDWEWFVTLTLNPEYCDRKDLDLYKKKLSTWIKNYNRIYETKIKYLLIPEEHKDGSWHTHGLLMGLPMEHLKEFERNEKLPIKMLIEITRGRKIYNWEAYAKAFGYITITKIRNIENISKYITKYITKELANTRIALNNHLYYCSKGLKRAKIICQGQLRQELGEEYSNEYVKIKTVHTLEEAIRYFKDEKDEKDRR